MNTLNSDHQRCSMVFLCISVRILFLFLLFVSFPNCVPNEATKEYFTLGAEIPISTGSESILHCEPSVAISHKAIIVAWNDSHGGMRSEGVPGVVVGWALSIDSGKNFEFGGYLPEFKTPETYMAADSWLLRDDQGGFFLNILSWEKERSVMHLYHMDKRNLGVWNKMSNPIECRAIDGVLDRPILTKNDSGLFLSYTFLEKKRKIKMMQIIKSTDKGKTWSSPKTLSDSNQRIRGSTVYTACLHDYILAVWLEGDDLSSLNEGWFALSKDSGKTFSQSKMCVKLNHEQGLTPEGYNIGQGLGPISMDATPVLGAVMHNNNGYFSLICNEGTENGSRLLHYSFNIKAEEFVPQEPLSNSPDSVFKILPAVPSICSFPAVLYYDRRNDHNKQTRTDIYFSFRKQKKLIETKLNSITTNWIEARGDSMHAPMQRVFGDYVSIDSYKKKLFAVWTDGRLGIPRIFGRLIEIN